MNYDTSSSCSIHPRVSVIGVCHLCLHHRLLILAVKNSQTQSNGLHQNNRPVTLNNNNSSVVNKKRGQVKITNKIFALRNSILTRFDSFKTKSNASFSIASSLSPATPDQDSFISIKFENNGVASWDKGISVSKVSLDHCNISWNNHKTTKPDTISSNNREGGAVIKHPEMPRSGSVRWRKRIGHMFQLIRWKRSSSKGSGGCHSNVRTSNGTNGWIRTLTKRRTKE